MLKLTNRTRTNGGPLFGINGSVILGHGSSRAEEIVAAITTAARYVELGWADIMREDLEKITQAAEADSAGTGAGR